MKYCRVGGGDGLRNPSPHPRVLLATPSSDFYRKTVGEARGLKVAALDFLQCGDMRGHGRSYRLCGDSTREGGTAVEAKSRRFEMSGAGGPMGPTLICSGGAGDRPGATEPRGKCYRVDGNVLKSVVRTVESSILPKILKC